MGSSRSVKDVSNFLLRCNPGQEVRLERQQGKAFFPTNLESVAQEKHLPLKNNRDTLITLITAEPKKKKPQEMGLKMAV